MTQNDSSRTAGNGALRPSDNGTLRPADKTRKLQRKRRVKRGIVASYLHELSPRHREGAAAALEPAVHEVAEPASAG
jgi:hypothetical protein